MERTLRAALSTRKLLLQRLQQALHHVIISTIISALAPIIHNPILHSSLVPIVYCDELID
jgi:hypothetical protein